MDAMDESLSFRFLQQLFDKVGCPILCTTPGMSAPILADSEDAPSVTSDSTAFDSTARQSDSMLVLYESPISTSLTSTGSEASNVTTSARSTRQPARDIKDIIKSYYLHLYAPRGTFSPVLIRFQPQDFISGSDDCEDCFELLRRLNGCLNEIQNLTFGCHQAKLKAGFYCLEMKKTAMTLFKEITDEENEEMFQLGKSTANAYIKFYKAVCIYPKLGYVGLNFNDIKSTILPVVKYIDTLPMVGTTDEPYLCKSFWLSAEI
jgi:hypothetical protein